MAKILYLEDDPKVSELVLAGLESQNHQVEHVADGREALDRLKLYHFEIAILDWTVPGMTGAEVLLEYRKAGGKIPIIMLTGMQELSQKEEALDNGADDYVTKPFQFRELAARVRALLRRPKAIQDKILEAGPLVLNAEQRTVFVDNVEIPLKTAEFALLEVFMKAPGRLFSSAELLDKLFTSDSEATDEAVRQRVFRLRKALGDSTVQIKTLSGQGYKLECGESKK